MADHLPLSVRVRKVNNELIFASELDKVKYDLFVKKLEENESLTVTYEINNDSGTYAQLSKIHKCIRELASYTGVTFEDMKAQVKIRSGLFVDGNSKSFADCSKEELSLVIQTILEIGDFIGFNLH